jgi:hypothetical protein
MCAGTTELVKGSFVSGAKSDGRKKEISMPEGGTRSTKIFVKAGKTYGRFPRVVKYAAHRVQKIGCGEF